MNETKTDIKIPHGDRRDITITGFSKKVGDLFQSYFDLQFNFQHGEKSISEHSYSNKADKYDRNSCKKKTETNPFCIHTHNKRRNFNKFQFIQGEKISINNSQYFITLTILIS